MTILTAEKRESLINEVQDTVFYTYKYVISQSYGNINVKCSLEQIDNSFYS